MRAIEFIFFVAAFLGVIIYGAASDSFVTLSHFSLAIFLGALPFLAIACLASGFLSAIPPIRFFRRFSSENRYSFWKGVLFGLFLPITPPAIPRLARELARRRLTGLGGLLYILAAPSLSPIVFFSTLVAFGLSWKMALTRYILGFIVVILVGFIFKVFFRSPEQIFIPPMKEETPEKAEENPSQMSTSGNSRRRVIEEAVRASADHFLSTARLLIIASLVIAILAVLLPRFSFEFLAEIPARAILAMIALSFTLSVPSPADSFVVVSLGSVPAWAKLAFLLVGPLLNLKLIRIYSSFLTRTAVIALILSTIFAVFVVMMIVVYSGIIFG